MRRTKTSAGRRASALAALLGLPSLPGGVAGVAQDPFLASRSEVYVNVTVIDGRGGPPRPFSSVLVRGGRIRDIGAQESIAVPEGTTVVDLSGAYLIPAFIDVHASPRTTEELRSLLAAGITGVRDPRGRGGFGDDPVPAVYVGGPVLEAGDEARGVPLGSEADAVAEVARQASDGAEFISLSSSVPAEWLVGIARAARRAGVPLWADRREGGWLLSLRAGAGVASPLVSGDPDLLPESEREGFEALAAGGGTRTHAAWLQRLEPHGPEVDRAVTALLSSDAALAPLLASAEASLGERDELQRVWPKAQALVKTLHDHGVRMIVGSDAPRTTGWGAGFHREMQLLVEAGIPALDVIGMATRNAAVALGRLHERGTIEIGKRADFLVLEANPVPDIRNASRISLVVIGGRAWSVGPNGVWERVRFNDAGSRRRGGGSDPGSRRP